MTKNKQQEVKIREMKQDEFLSLAAYRAYPCVSIYTPMFKDERGQYDGNRIHLKNCLQVAAQTLEREDMNPPEINNLLEEARQTLDDSAFWAHQQNGLAVLISPEFTRFYPVSQIEEEMTFVGHQFILRPLLPLLTNAFEGFLLSLSQNEANFYRVTRNDLVALHVEGMPESMAEAMAFDDPEARLQSHSATGSTEQGAIYHGHHPKDEENSRLTRYCHQIAKAIETYVAADSDNTPLILAGTTELTSIFRNVSDMEQNLLDRQIEGNVEELSTSELHEKVWIIVEEHHQTRRYDAARRYKDLDHANLTASTIEDVVRTAHFGQIDTLFITKTGAVMGHYEIETGRVFVEEENDGDHQQIDLLDLAAVKTLENGGTVIPLKGPADPPAAAILRFAIKSEEQA